MLRLVAETAPSPVDSGVAQLITAIILLLTTAAGALWSHRAANKGTESAKKLDVPDGDGQVRSPGAVLGNLQHDVATAAHSAQMAAESTERIAERVEAIQMTLERHLGQHEGMVRDLERLMRKAFNGDSK